jgi:UDP-3-O-[3-hydroxymyristoyl] glucosamine N-acyltransferase
MKNNEFKVKDILVGKYSHFFGKIKIEKGVKIGHHCIIGFSSEDKESPFEFTNLDSKEVTFLGQGTVVNPFSLIFRGAKIGKNVEIHEYSRIGVGTRIGDGTKIVYGAKIYDDVIIGKRCIIAGFCCNGSKIGDEVTMMGHLIHKYPIHAIDIWDSDEAEEEPSPIIEDNVIIGYNSLIIGGIRIGRNSYIAAGSIICDNILPNKKVIMHRKYQKLKLCRR